MHQTTPGQTVLLTSPNCGRCAIASVSNNDSPIAIHINIYIYICIYIYKCIYSINQCYT